MSIDDDGDEGCLDGDSYQEADIPIVEDIGFVEGLLYAEVDDAYHHAVETEDEHGADGDIGDEATSEGVECFRKVDEDDYGYQVHHIVKGDVKRKNSFIDMPIE